MKASRKSKKTRRKVARTPAQAAREVRYFQTALKDTRQDAEDNAVILAYLKIRVRKTTQALARSQRWVAHSEKDLANAKRDAAKSAK